MSLKLRTSLEAFALHSKFAKRNNVLLQAHLKSYSIQSTIVAKRWHSHLKAVALQKIRTDYF